MTNDAPEETTPEKPIYKRWWAIALAVLILLVLLIVLVAVATDDDVEEEIAATPEVEEPEADDEPDPTPEPEPEPDPTPAPVPEPNQYQGSGDDVIAIEPPEEGRMTFHITGNDAGRHFAVAGYTADGNRTDTFVNTTDPYSGVVFDTGETRELEISAQGPWTVEVQSIRAAETVQIPGETDGGGDYVFQLDGDARTVAITGNEAGRHFAVEAYDASGSDLLVNTTEPYDGRVRLPSGAEVIVVTAVGEWSMTFEG